MSTLTKVVVVLALAIFVGAQEVGGASALQQSREASTETVEERLARLRDEKVFAVTDSCQLETDPTEKAVCLRAELIKLKKKQETEKKEITKKDSSEMKEARRQLEKEARDEQKRQKDLAGVLANANITGCDGQNVEVNPKATSHRTLNSYVKVRVTNPGPLPVDIEDAQYGLLVRNLCAGGGITLFRNRTLADADYTTFRFIAKARFSDGSLGMDESQQYTLSKYDWSSGRGKQYYDWTLRLRRVQ